MLIIALIPIVICLWVALKKKYSFLTSVQVSCIGCALSLLIVLLYIYAVTGKDVVSYVTDYAKPLINQNVINFNDLFNTMQSLSGNTVGAQVNLSNINDFTLQMITDYTLIALAAFIPLGGLVLYLIVRGTAKLAGRAVVPIPAFADFKLPPRFGRWSIVILVVCLIGLMAGWHNFDIVFIITVAFFGSIYFIQGMAFTEWWLKRSIKYAIIRVMIIAFLLWLLFFIFVIIGFIEQIIKTRQRTSNANKGKL